VPPSVLLMTFVTEKSACVHFAWDLVNDRLTPHSVNEKSSAFVLPFISSNATFGTTDVVHCSVKTSS
jgi:hypothetical protein